MGINNDENKIANKYLKKVTKYGSCLQKLSRPRYNYHFEAERFIRSSFETIKIQREIYPTLHSFIQESLYNSHTINERVLTIKQCKILMNSNFLLCSQEQPFLNKKLNLDGLFVKSNNAIKCISKSLRKNQLTKEESRRLVPSPSSTFFQKSYHSQNPQYMSTMKRCNQSHSNIGLAGSEYSSVIPMMLVCSEDSLQFQSDNVVNVNILSKEKSVMITSGEDHRINDTILQPMNGTVNADTTHMATMALNDKNLLQDNKEDSDENPCSSASSCSSLSSTKEYYLPAVSSSNVTLQVSHILAKHKLFKLANARNKLISQCNNAHNCQQNLNMTSICSDQPVNNDTISLANKAIIQDEDNDKKSDEELIMILKDDNSLLPLKSINNVLNLAAGKRPSKEKHTIGGGKKEEVIQTNFIDSMNSGSIEEEKKINNMKENFIEQNCDGDYKPSKLSVIDLSSNISPPGNVEGVTDKVDKLLIDEKACTPWVEAGDKKKVISLSEVEMNDETPDRSNSSLFQAKNITKSEDVLCIMNNNKNTVIANITEKTEIPLSSTNENPVPLPCQFINESFVSISNDSFNIPKETYLKLEPLFDLNFNHPKISKLIIPSKVLAEDCNSKPEVDINKYVLKEQLTVSTNKKDLKSFFKNLSEKYRLSATRSLSSGIKQSLKAKDNEPVIDKRYSGDEAIFTQSIIYGSNAFKKIKDKYDQKEIGEKGKLLEKLSTDKKTINTTQENTYVDTNSDPNENIMNLESQSANQTILKSSANNTNIVRLFDGKKNKLIGTASDPSTYLSSQHVCEKKNIDYLIPETKVLDDHNFNRSRSLEKKSHINTFQETVNSTNNSGTLEVSHIEKDSLHFKVPSLSTTPDRQHLTEKATQVNMDLKGTVKIQEEEYILNGIKEKENYTNNRKSTELCQKPTKGARMTINGQHVILYNSSGYPVTDLEGRLLKNNLGAYLLSTDNLEEIIKNKLPVYDCDHIAASRSCSNPTKVPLVKLKLKITDRSGNPQSLYNNLGMPLTDESGHFLHDNRGELLVKMDGYNFPICCKNGSPIYLPSGAMLLSQKFKFIVSSPSTVSLLSYKKSNESINTSIVREKRIISFDDGNSSNYSHKDDTGSLVITANNDDIFTLNLSKPKGLLRSKFQMNEEKLTVLNKSLLLSLGLPELTLTCLANEKNINNSLYAKYPETIPKLPIPIFDLEGNRLTDENGYPLKNNFGEYVLLLDKNGYAISDSCGGPIFDSKGKQLLLKDLYEIYNPSLVDHSYEPSCVLPEHNCWKQGVSTSSEEEIPVVDLKFEGRYNSEPVMNYLKDNSIQTYNVDVEEFNWYKEPFQPSIRNATASKIVWSYTMPLSETYNSSIKSQDVDSSFYQTENYENRLTYENVYQLYNEQQCDYWVPYSDEMYLYEGHQPEMENICLDESEYLYIDHGIPEGKLPIESDKFVTEEEEYFVQ